VVITQKRSINTPESERWNTLLDGLSVERLTNCFLDRVLQLEDYRDGTLPASEIRRTAAASFEALIESLRSGQDSPELVAARQDIALEVGVSRARAGLPVESLMTAIRQDFTVLWSELTALAGSSDAELMVHRAETVWEVVDSYAAQTQATYMRERQRMAQEASSLRQGHVAALFGTAVPPPEILSRIAEGLGVAAGATLVVAATTTENTPALHLVVAAAARRGTDLFTHPMPDGLTAFWAADDRPGSPRQEATAQVRSLRCGLVEQVPGLAGVRTAAQTARTLASLAGEQDSGALTMSNAWARLARLRLAETGAPVVPDVDSALASCGPAERARLSEAVRSYLASGSVARSAEELFCHRNTLMNRLHRFEQLTGIDVTVPQQAARLVVAWS